MDIFERMRNGELILHCDPEYNTLDEALQRGMRITGKLNASCHNREETREILSELTRQNAWIGVASIILPGVTIGENAPNTIVGGNPAKVTRKIKTE